MKATSRFFDIRPRVVRADAESTVTVRPLYDQVMLDPSRSYTAVIYPAEHYGAPHGDALAARLVQQDGLLRITHHFAGEQEHILEVLDPDAEDQVVLRVLLYSVAADLFDCRPLKGDLHMHSHHSDGRESPAFVAASCRRIGLDFMALTDHGQYAPALEAQQAFAGVAHDLLICPGEEVHPPDNSVHMVNFGGSFSVNEEIAAERPAYDAAVATAASALPDVEQDAVRQQLASCSWVFQRIRAGGGLGIFCHPYWHVRQGYTPAGDVTAALFAHKPFDAYEVIGGYGRDAVDSNTLQVARYHEERARGNEFAIVGVSDAHGCHNSDLFGWYYTLVFAAGSSQEAIIAAIRAGRSVAVESIPGEATRAYGPLRLVQYALFVLGELMPVHDELCAEEGRQMLAHAAGDPAAAVALEALRGQCQEWWNGVAGRSPERCAGG
jgi:hypothetical protein